jgi:RHH-type proline utilization regulon transcriptional repressor/proline dehydrogenase/delta 1-pyrroline-5-carboxylate dehydrogenase
MERMERDVLEHRIKARGREFFANMAGGKPSLFNKRWRTGKIMDWCMRNEAFKVQLFRFVDVLPYLSDPESLSRHIEEYFASQGHDLPAVLKWGARGAALGGKFTGRMLAKTIRSNIEGMARQFILGENTGEAMKALRNLRKDRFAVVVDILGEATVSEQEADHYQQRYLELLDFLEKEQEEWESLGAVGSHLDWGCAPKINISLKPSAFYSQARPSNFEGSVEAIYARLKPVLLRVKQLGGFACIDMEQYSLKDITLEVYRRLRSDAEFRSYPYLGMVLQSYLRDTDQDLERLLDWAGKETVSLSIRLVKGAYWDYEVITAKEKGWRIPVYTRKMETDAAFERHARVILENHHLCHLACGSHNIRSIASVMESALALGVPEERYEFQLLYGMAETVRKVLLDAAKRVRLYCPYGELVPGMSYLVRRLLENTANESFLRQSYAEGADIEKLLQNPEQVLREQGESKKSTPDVQPPEGNEKMQPFQNEPQLDLTSPGVRSAFSQAIIQVRRQLGRTYPLIINGKPVKTSDTLPSLNPAKPTEVVGTVFQAGRKEIDEAIAAAGKAFESWREAEPQERAQYLFRAAEAARKRKYELAAWQVLEVGKQWDQAYADVGEAIDFMEYYAREMIRLGAPRRMGNVPGEINHYFYQPKGLAAVIAPWNFPLAISCGMSSAAVVTGNCVLYKPSGLSSVVGYTLAEIFREAGLPPGVFNYTPGRGSVIGDYLVEHPLISVIAFTGSMEVGLRILQKASMVYPGQQNIKKVIAEMGGKNAIIIDDDADLDEAVVHVLFSAFGFQGQKCSACSRVIVVKAIYDKFVRRLLEAARSIKIGPAEDPSNYMGPVVDEAAQKKILKYIEMGKKEGTLLLTREVPEEGYYVPPTIFGDITPAHRLAQEEIFGPVLSIMKVDDFDQALRWAVSTPFALTGGVFSRSPRHLEQARKQFRVGNLYLNRGIVGALVERQPFGGFKMSGIGSKAGGPDYLLQFMDPRTVTENTMRRGFAPINKDDKWTE